MAVFLWAGIMHPPMVWNGVQNPAPGNPENVWPGFTCPRAAVGQRLGQTLLHRRK